MSAEKSTSSSNKRKQQQQAPRRSWLEGPQVPAEREDPNKPSEYQGQQLGLPATGKGSLASLFRRMGALLIDWLMCYGMAVIITSWTDWLGHYSTFTLILFVIWRIVTIWLFAQTPGHAMMGIGVARVDNGAERVGLWRAVVRTLLTIFMFPPIIQDADGRGMHDRATGTAVIHTR